MKKLFYFIFALTLFSCSSNDDSNDDSNQTFRNIYSDSYWLSDGAAVYFSSDKLMSLLTDDNLGECFYFQEGSYDNINSDGCIYNNVTLSLITEDTDTFSFKQLITDGSSCDGYEITITFQAINENLISVSIQDDEGLETENLTKIDDNPIPSVTCVNGTLNNFLL